MSSYRFCLASPEQIPEIQKIEMLAASMFSETELPAALRSAPMADCELRDAIGRDDCWVILNEVHSLVGFCVAQALNANFHIKEVSIHPCYSGKGLGRRFIKYILKIARERNYAAVTLTTFSHIPWNAPFYERLGFHALETPRLSEALAHCLARERALGLANRIAMQLILQ